ncbi:flagellar basal body rod protein FlgB [Magnetovibrio sp. PR-2]|uniref:flagellar basal body rod protein FlgB n=1 Tax=Magnetovibrio sp. PR-2 TaxID=3120356 RepID=UPI002FCE4C9E
MDLNKLTLFGMVKGQMNWLNKRQEVLAQNVANADTPDYKPQDLKPVNFREVMRDQHKREMMNRMSGTAVAGLGGSTAFKPESERAPYETSPDGNAVVLEEQMGKIGETQMKYSLANELYRKHIGMIKIALGKQR